MINDILINKKHDNILVYSCVFWAIFNFAYNFTTFTGGGPGPIIIRFKLNFVFEIYIALLLLLFYIAQPSSFTKNQYNQVSGLIVSCGAAICFLMHIASLNYFIERVILCILIYIFLQLRNNVKYRILHGFVKCLGLLVFFSLVEYIVYIIFDFRVITFSNIIYADLHPGDLTIFNFMHQKTIMGSVIGVERFYRFQSFTNEPGSLGTTAALLLFVIGGKKCYLFEYVVFWVAGILTLSMAFYLLALIHLICLNIKKRRFALLLCLSFIAAYFFINNKDFFDSIFSQRLEETDGAVDNRVSSVLQQRLERAWADGSLWFGRGNEDADDATGAGIKLMLYQNGIVGVLVLILTYAYSYLFILKSQHLRSVYACMVFFFAFWINFYQRSDIFLFQYVVPYFCLPAFMKYFEVKVVSEMQYRRVKQIPTRTDKEP